MPFRFRLYQRFPEPFLKLPPVYFLSFASLITLLLLSNGLTYAEWVVTVQNDQTGVTIYVDSDTIRCKGNLVNVWELINYKAIQTMAGTSYLSARVQREYDCAGDLQRTLALTKLSGNMGTGKVMFTNSDQHKWEPVDPGSICKRLWKVACNKQ